MTGMGVLRWTSVCALLVLTAVLAGGIGCRNDKSDDDKVTKTGPLDVTHNQVPVNPGSPGLEPPDVTGNPAQPGMATGGSSAPTGMVMGSAGSPSSPMAGATGGNTSTPGNAAGSGGVPTMNPTVDAGAPADAGTADGGTSDPCAEPECGIDQPCTGTERQCIFLTGCTTAVCIDGLRACQIQCGGTDNCQIFESFPAQIGCN
jgi:hypothetical protein